MAIVMSATKEQHAEFIEAIKEKRVVVAPRAIRMAQDGDARVVVDKFCGDFMSLLLVLKQIPDGRHSVLYVLRDDVALTAKEQRLFDAVVAKAEGVSMAAFVESLQ